MKDDNGEECKVKHTQPDGILDEVRQGNGRRIGKDSVQTMWLYKCTSEQHVPMIQTQQVWELYKHAQQAYIFLRTLGDTGGAHDATHL